MSAEFDAQPLKRLTYASRPRAGLAAWDRFDIESASIQNNAGSDITGLLVFTGGYFFQVLEGPRDPVDRTFQRIRRDPRHSDVTVLTAEEPISERQFPEWSMRLIALDEASDDAVARPVRVLLDVLARTRLMLDRYTQPTVRKLVEQGLNPLAFEPRSTEKIIFFADIQSFSLFARVLPSGELVQLVNTFLEAVTNAILVRGGEISKYIGDAVMAYFPGDQADSALLAALDALEALAQVRAAAPAESAHALLWGGAGLAHGSVVEGTFGSTHKADFTIVGDAVNLAARIEAATRQAPHLLLFEEGVRAGLRRPWPLVTFEPLALKGQGGTTRLFSVDLPIAAWPGERDAWAEQIATAILALAGSTASKGR